MPGLDRNITPLGFDVPRGINDFLIGIPGRIFLQGQVITGQHIAALVGDTVGIQRQVIRRIQQHGIGDSAWRGQRQAAAGAGKAVNGNIAPAGQGDISAPLDGSCSIQHDPAAAERAAPAPGGDLPAVGELPAGAEVNRLALEYAFIVDRPVAGNGQGFPGRQRRFCGEGVGQLQSQVTKGNHLPQRIEAGTAEPQIAAA